MNNLKAIRQLMKFICALSAFAMVSIIQVGNAEAYAPYTAKEALSIHQSTDSYAETEDMSNCSIELGLGWSTYVCAWKDGDRVSYFYRLAFKVKLKAVRYKLKADYDTWYRALTVDSYQERTQSHRNKKLIIQDLTLVYGDVDYYYDENAVIEEHNAGDDSLLAHYRYADRLLSLDTGTTVQYYHHDALGSTVNLTNTAGAVQVSYKLDPWGRIKSQTGTSVNRQIFTGQEHDENTGLIYFGARYYDPDTARFLTQDTYLGEPGTPPSLHRYLYAYSNPTVYVDLYGNIALLENASDFIRGLADKSRESVATLNRSSWKTKNVASFTALFASTILMEYGSGLLDLGAGIVDVANFGVDLSIATHTLPLAQVGVSNVGHESRRNVENVFRSVSDATKEVGNFITSEDRMGTYSEGLASLKTGVSNKASATLKGIKEGDLTVTAPLGAAVIDIADVAAGATKLATKQGSKQLGKNLDTVQTVKKTVGDVASESVTQQSKVRGWKSGDLINRLTAKGNVPKWNTVRQRHWKNRALNSKHGEFSAENLDRMRKGLAPKDPVTGLSKELHHTPPQREGGLFDVQEVWPWEHEAIDHFRKLGGNQ